MIRMKIDEEYLEEIISILAMHGRPDLIEILRDDDYRPPLRVKKEILSDTEGSAEEESDYEVEVDEKGFQSLK
jgi:hypothetical protein